MSFRREKFAVRYIATCGSVIVEVEESVIAMRRAFSMQRCRVYISFYQSKIKGVGDDVLKEHMVERPEKGNTLLFMRYGFVVVLKEQCVWSFACDVNKFVLIASCIRTTTIFVQS